MKKILLFLGFLWLLPQNSNAEGLIVPSRVFDDSPHIILARSVKLGRQVDIMSSSPNKNEDGTSSPKEKYDCVKNTDCSGGYICQSNKCVDPCAGVTCAAGKKCSSGSCSNCSANDTTCGCPNGKVANGSGSCYCKAPLQENSSGKCVTPACSSNAGCASGQKCVNAGSGDAYCTNCTSGQSGSACNCPSVRKPRVRADVGTVIRVRT